MCCDGTGSGLLSSDNKFIFPSIFVYVSTLKQFLETFLIQLNLNFVIIIPEYSEHLQS